MKTKNNFDIEMSDSRLLDKSLLFHVCLAVIILFAVLLLNYDMGQGPWAFSDSAQYIDSGKNLITQGRLGIYAPDGHFMPLTLHPPLYSLILSPFLAFTVDIFAVIKWMNILFFCASIAVISIGIFKITGMAMYGLMTGFIFAVSTPLLKVFDGAMSEPLFILLTLINLILLCSYLVRPSRGKFWGAVITAALVPLARYIGAVSIGLGFILMVAFSAGSRGKRWLRAITYGVISAIPVIVWFVYTFFQNRSLGSRTLDFNINLLGATSLYKKSLMEVLVTWLPYHDSWFPTWEWKSTALLLIVLFTAAVFLLVLWKGRKARDEQGRAMITIIGAGGIYILGFLAFLWISLFSSVQPDYNERMFTPLFPMLFIVLLGVLLAGIRVFKLKPVFYLLPLLVLAIYGNSNWITTVSAVNDHHINQIGYGTPAWRNSPLVAAVRELPEGLTLYSNKADAVLLYTGKYPFSVKLLKAEKVTVPAEQTGEILDPSQLEGRAALIIFTKTLSGDSPVSLNGLSVQMKTLLESVAPYLSTEDGTIYLLNVSQ